VRGDGIRPFGRAVLLLVPVVLLAPQTITVTVKPGVTFEDYRTFAWRKGRPVPDALTDDIIVKAVEDELVLKDLWRDDEDPDLDVSYYAAVKSEVVIDSPYRTSWYDEGTIRVRSIHEGTLLIDVVDVAKNELLWRAMATRTLTDDPFENRNRIRDTVRKLVERFPR
jgi:hypothetical protein